MYKILWSDTAWESYKNEVDFVFKKWGTVDAVKFINIVEDLLNVLKAGKLVGKPS